MSQVAVRSHFLVVHHAAKTAIFSLALAACGGGQDRTSDPTPRADARFPGTLEYGRAPTNVFLSSEPGRYCRYRKETWRACDGDSFTQNDTFFVCIDGNVDCSANTPPGFERNGSMCFEAESYTALSVDPDYGDCATHDRYLDQDPEIECLFQAHCPNRAECVDFKCVCPSGNCGCQACSEAELRPTCLDDTVLFTPEAPLRCDESKLCPDLIAEGFGRAESCADRGQICDATRGACVDSPTSGCECTAGVDRRCEGLVLVETERDGTCRGDGSCVEFESSQLCSTTCDPVRGCS